MTKPIQNGKKHISEKPKPKSFKDLFKPINLLDVPPEIEEECRQRNLAVRWINANQFAKMGNFHKNHWELYRRDSATPAPSGGLFGLPADGTVRRGDAVLAVRPMEIHQGHKEVLEERAKATSRSLKGAGKRLKDDLRASGINSASWDETEFD